MLAWLDGTLEGEWDGARQNEAQPLCLERPVSTIPGHFVGPSIRPVPPHITSPQLTLDLHSRSLNVASHRSAPLNMNTRAGPSSSLSTLSPSYLFLCSSSVSSSFFSPLILSCRLCEIAYQPPPVLAQETTPET